LPLHPKRLARRGYNQAAIIATATANILNTPMVTDSLVRVKYTDSQVSTKSRVERLQNMEHAFVVKNHDALANKHVLLIDDVLTTGATIEAAANELLKVPNIQLSIATAGLAIQ
jgi:predicted amidophosphoribosyltransferase